ncbi:MAG: hypothetical protein JWR07_2971 [Nevskia sp.]|nr:hypothetical protein [Nevskia sp.]
MKTIRLLLLAMLSCAAGASTTGTYQYTCKSANGKCPPPPVPPIPPAPPAPPALPSMAALPALPAPPAAPPMPAIPAAAHAACAGKSAGTTLTYMIAVGETMTGTCESEDGRMLFILRSYSVDR